jgi:hypothetical protein
MLGGRGGETAPFVFFPREQNFDSPQIDPLPGKIRYFPAEQKVFFVVNSRPVSAEPGNFQ